MKSRPKAVALPRVRQTVAWSLLYYLRFNPVRRAVVGDQAKILSGIALVPSGPSTRRSPRLMPRRRLGESATLR